MMMVGGLYYHDQLSYYHNYNGLNEVLECSKT